MKHLLHIVFALALLFVQTATAIHASAHYFHEFHQHHKYHHHHEHHDLHDEEEEWCQILQQGERHDNVLGAQPPVIALSTVITPVDQSRAGRLENRAFRARCRAPPGF